MATITEPTLDPISDLLGSEAAELLEHRCQTIDRSLLHLPGPDFIERVLLNSDRSTRDASQSTWSCLSMAAWLAPAT